MTDILVDFATWAWARHHNEWSWYIRPFFLLPFCWFAWRRNAWGIALTLVALATSMFWFPEPERPHPAVVQALAAEKAYLLSPWTWWKWALAASIPAFLLALGAAFWRRSVLTGLMIVNAMVVTKILWTFEHFTADAALRHFAPAMTGLIACNVAILIGWRLAKGHARSARS